MIEALRWLDGFNLHKWETNFSQQKTKRSNNRKTRNDQLLQDEMRQTQKFKSASFLREKQKKNKTAGLHVVCLLLNSVSVAALG